MQCNCGGTTKDHNVVENKKLVGQYARCTACGRIMWLFDNREKK